MRFILLCLLSFACVGCGNAWRTGKSQAEADNSEYARKAYREQRIKEGLDKDNQKMDQLSEKDLLVEITEDPEARWAKLPYETAEEWLERMNATLRAQNDELISMQRALDGTQETERSKVSEIQQLLQVQQDLREAVAAQARAREENKDNEFQDANEKAAPEFFIHLVKPKDTLYSIAMHYYGNKEKVADILRWNQLWVRSEYELIAGLGLILFPAGVNEPSTQVVEKFIDEMELPR